MKRLYEIKGYIGTYKEEVPVIETICRLDISPIEKLQEILEMEDRPEGVATGERAIIKDARALMENRHKTIREIKNILNYYASIYGKLEHIIRNAEKEMKERRETPLKSKN